MAFQKFSNMEQSLFTRFVRLGVPTVELDAQGRARSGYWYTVVFPNVTSLSFALPLVLKGLCKQWEMPPSWVKRKTNYSVLKEYVYITQQVQKELRMDKLEEDWNGLQLWFFKKTCQSNSFFQSSFLLFVTFYILLGRHICSTQSSERRRSG